MDNNSSDRFVIELWNKDLLRWCLWHIGSGEEIEQQKQYVERFIMCEYRIFPYEGV